MGIVLSVASAELELQFRVSTSSLAFQGSADALRELAYPYMDSEHYAWYNYC